MKKPRIIAVVGPTASGKTSLAIEIAKKFNGEVISADSRQVYRSLDIGTGKVTLEEMNGVPHHLLDVVDLDDVYTATNFTRDAAAAIEQLLDSGRRPIIAGGTFFYLDQLRGKNTAAPVEPDEAFRQSINGYSTATLYEKLAEQDPIRAAAIDPNNRRRLIRSLEIVHALGFVPPPTTVTSPYDWLMVGLAVSKDDLQKKFQVRITSWLKNGFTDEVILVRKKVSPARFNELGFEYTLMAEHLDGHLTRDELIERFVQKNWQYARRQMTWLKRDQEIEWFAPEDRSAIFRHVETFLDE